MNWHKHLEPKMQDGVWMFTKWNIMSMKLAKASSWCFSKRNHKTNSWNDKPNENLFDEE